MKKLLSLTLIFAAVLALGLTGCKNSPDDLPGTWSNALELYQYSSAAPFNVGKLTVSDYTVTYELNQPSGISNASALKEGYYRSTCYYMT